MFQFFSRQVRNERGFTLIELLIVVAIIAILAAILIPNFLRARAQSQLAASKGNLKNLATALESYFVDRGNYPTVVAALSPDYLRVVPPDPCSKNAYVYTITGSAPTDYKLAIDFPAGNACDSIVPGLNYTPGGGLQETP
jgi:prepilin-type N-terminal cleavage/methylation domain-containing protein